MRTRSQHNSDNAFFDENDIETSNVNILQAVSKDLKTMIEPLLLLGADINERNEKDETLFHIAIRKGHIEIAKTLFSSHLKINARASDNATPLHYAVLYKQKEILDLILSDFTVFDQGETVDINARTEDGYTSLHIAVQDNLVEAVALLLSKGAEVNIIDNHHKTPLYYALMRGYTQIIDSLLSKGAKVNAKNSTERVLSHKQTDPIDRASNEFSSQPENQENQSDLMRLADIAIEFSDLNTLSTIKPPLSQRNKSSNKRICI